jgi:hypothetical protein
MVYVCIPTTRERKKRLDDCISAIRSNAGYSNYSIVVYENIGEGYQVAVRKMVSGLGDSLVMVINDDMIVENNFLINSYSAYVEKFPNMDGLGSLNDNNMYVNVAIVPFAPASILYNYIYSGYTHYGGDPELAQIFISKNRFLPIHDAIINHIHPFYDKSNKRPDIVDETYKSTKEKFWDKDNNLFLERRKASKKYSDLSLIELNCPDYIPKYIDK